MLFSGNNMGLDIRIPIGLLLFINGVLLAGYGAMSDPEMYRRSLGININLWWGAALVVAGAVLLYFGRRGKRV